MECPPKNIVISPNFLVYKLCGKAQFPHSPKLSENGAFPPNIHTRKLGESTKFFPVMIYLDGNVPLDILYEKSLRYQHHKENYQKNLLEGLIPSGLLIKKHPDINAISDKFEGKWNLVL